jgi:uncharacterized protein (TIGR03545 family)
MAVIKKVYTTKRFDRLKRDLHSPHHTERLEKLFVEQDGRYTLRDDLNKEEKKFLKEAGKIAKENRGLVRIGMLVIIGLPLAGLVVFSLFFMNPLLTRLLESGLESLFRADAEVTGLQLRPLQPGLSIAAIVQGDENRPMTNLFEIEDIELRFNLDALLRGSMVIENLQAGSISWGGERRTSAALEEHAADEPDAPADSQGGGWVSSTGGSPALLGNLSADSAMAELQALVRSPDLIASFSDEVRSAVPAWSSRADEIAAESEGFRSEYSGLLSTDIASINDAATLASLADEFRRAGQEAKALSDNAVAGLRSSQAEFAVLQEGYREIRASIDEEIALVRSQVDAVRAGSIGEPLEGLLRNLVGQALGEKAALLFRGLELYERFRESGGARDADAPSVSPEFRPGGVEVPFPIPQYPDFLLRRAAVGVDAGGAGNQSLEITNLSNQPELLAEPARIEYTGVIGVPAEVRIEVDARDPGVNVTSVSAAARGVSLSFDNPPQFLGLDSIGGPSDIDFSIVADSRAESLLDSRITLIDPDIVSADASRISQAISEALDSAERLFIDFESELAPDGALVDPQMSSNIPGIISSAVGVLVSEEIDRYRSELGARLDEYQQDLYSSLSASYAPALEGIGGIDAAAGEAAGFEDRLGSLEQSARQRIADLAAEQAGEVTDTIRDAAGEAAQNLPSLPGLPGRR